MILIHQIFLGTGHPMTYFYQVSAHRIGDVYIPFLFISPIKCGIFSDIQGDKTKGMPARTSLLCFPKLSFSQMING